MSFAAPWFLLAALAGAIPVVLHLIHRRKAREVHFSTLRFLKASVQRTRRRKVVDDAALMALRLLVLVLVALGLARPALSGLSGLIGQGAGTAAAIVLDDSGSMALRDDGAPRFETARQVAEQVLAGLGEGDAAALLLTSGRPDPVLGRLQTSHDILRQALAEAKPGCDRADLAIALDRASALVAASGRPNQEVYVITDDQAISWENLGARNTASGPRPPVVLVDVGRVPMLNAAVRDVRLQTPAPLAGATVVVTAEVVNTSTVTMEKHLEFHVDGVRESVSPTLTLAPGAAATQEFRFTPEKPGLHRGHVRLVEDDGSALDNRRDFVLAIDQRVPVAVVKPTRPEIAQADDAFYLEQALAPGGPDGPIQASTLTADELATTPLSGFAIVFCVNLPAVAPAAADRLVEYARSGGHVVWICGSNVQADAYNQANARAQGRLLPASLGDRERPPPKSAGSWRIGALDADHPALAPLTEPASLYQTVLIYQYFPMTLPTEAPPRVLAALDDGRPLLVERSIGAGSVLLLGTGVHVDWTNLPLKPIFLPLVARLTFHLAGAEASRWQVSAGAPFEVPPPVGEAVEVEVVRPDGAVVRLRGDRPTSRTFRYADTHEPGVYQVRLLGAVPPKSYAFAVNMDSKETDSTTLAPGEVERRLVGRRVVVCRGAEELAGAVARLRDGISLRGGFLLVVLIGLVVETFLANRAGGLPAAATQSQSEPVSESTPASAEEDRVPLTPSGDEVAAFLARLGGGR